MIRLRPCYASAALAFLSAPLQAGIDFARDVRPILNNNCTACHGGVKEAAGISFIYRDQVLGKGESGKTVIVPGNPDASEMIARIESTDPDEVMPKPGHGPALRRTEIATLRQWITEGAGWGEHWSFTTPEKHPLPAVRKTDWPRRDADHFILARLEAEGLTPSPEARPELWLRRASLDLTGLPPSPAELDAYQLAAAAGPEAAIARETDRLLASPRFGERWASVWMDLARYAESGGLGADQRREIWKYRDWVIDAFNRDLPYDQFTTEQLAGDLIPGATLDQKIATAFHRLTQVNEEGGTDDEEFRVTAVIDRVNTTWEVWQGLTFGCVQCHAHPYEPIKHEEFYRFMGFFNQTADADISEDLPKLPVPLDPARYAEANRLTNQIHEAENVLHEVRSRINAATPWQPARSITATADKAKLTISEIDGIEEYRADANAAAGATWKLTFPAALPVLTALRVEFLPLDETTASHTPEWGAVLQQITVEMLDAGGKATPVKLHEVIADEAHPFFDPNGSLQGKGRGWGTYTKTFGPRHAVIVLADPLTLAADTRLRVTLRNGGMYLASFPLISKRGRISLTGHPDWITHRHDTRVTGAAAALAAARKSLQAIPSTTLPVMAERDPAFPRATHVFTRGNWLNKGQRLESPGTPGLFPPLRAEHPAKPNRLDLARWIASPGNPLTARVAVNRFWLELFGTGLVPTPEDFGSSGERPTHPDLLDTLAMRFATDLKWSIKSLLRELVTSAAYRQDAALMPELARRDPANRLLARGPRQRLTGEMVRDQSLAAAGLLSAHYGGPPAFPPLPAGVWNPFTNDPWKTPEPGDEARYRRSIYTYWKRSIPYPLFTTFDAPARDLASKRRLPSNTPLQALTVLNDPAFQEAAAGLAKRMLAQGGSSPDTRLAFGYRTATSRAITADRLTELRTLLQQLQRGAAQAPSDDAAFTVLASVLLNLDESLTR